MITWFIYLLLNGGIFLIVVWVAALKLIPNLARPETKAASSGWVLLTLIVVTTLLFVMPSVVKWSRTIPAKHKLAFYCKGQEVGKHVYERVADVTEVFSYLPARDLMDDFMHRNDITVIGHDNYTKLPEKRYQSFESTSFDPKAEPVAPVIRYGFTWTSLTSIQDRNNKLYGDETTIFDNETGKVLATRVVYYILSDKEDHLEAACSVDDMDIRHVGYYEGNMVDNYHFVSSVLKPVELSEEDKLEEYDVVPGGGTRKYPSICIKPIHVAEGFGRNDVSVQRSGDDLVVSLKSSPQDSYACGFFGAQSSAEFPDEGKIPRILFADGQFIASPELFAKFATKDD